MSAKAVYDAEREERAPCKSCGRPMVLRFNTTSGKYSPWDPPEPCSGCRPGNYVSPPHGTSFVDRNGKQAIAMCDGAGTVWISHWATCPTADVHRKAAT